MDLKHKTYSKKTKLISKNNNALLLNQINLNDASILQAKNMILNRNTNRRMKIVNVSTISDTTENKRYEEPITLKTTKTSTIKFDQIPDDDSIPISSDEESEVKTNTPLILKTLLNTPKTVIYPKRSRYKTPFKPTKDSIRYVRKPLSYLDREEMLQNFTKRKETNPALTLLDCCVLIGKSVILDHTIMIPPLEFKAQLNRTGDTMQKVKLMPGTKQEIYRLQTGFVKLFANPAHRITNPKLLQMFHTNCITNKTPNWDVKMFDLLPVAQDSLPDLIPKTKFGYAYDKKIDTNDHVYSKTLGGPAVPVLKPRRKRSESLDSVNLLTRKHSVENALYGDFDENSLDSDDIVCPMDPVETVPTDMTANDVVVEVVEESIDNDEITGELVLTDHVLIDSDQTIEYEIICEKNDNCEILGIESDVIFT